MKTIKVVPPKLSDLLTRLDNMYKEGSLTPEQLKGFLDSLERKFIRKQPKHGSEPVEHGAPGKFEEIISYQRSQVIWGTKNRFPETQNPKYLIVKPASVFMNYGSSPSESAWEWKIAWLNGLSVQEIAQKFPQEVVVDYLAKYDWFKQPAQPGYYLISWKNPFVNFSKSKEDHNLPDDCQRLPGNLLLEFLVTMRQLGHTLPKVYFRTGFASLRGGSLCLGPKNGQSPQQTSVPLPNPSPPLMFSRAKGGHYKRMIAFCVMKSREWEIETISED